jgi:hypothetical protein
MAPFPKGGVGEADGGLRAGSIQGSGYRFQVLVLRFAALTTAHENFREPDPFSLLRIAPCSLNTGGQEQSYN